jgi:putative endonuclease
MRPARRHTADVRSRVPDPRQVRGRRAEDAAASHLLGLDHAILARNLRLGRLEVDLVSLAPDGHLVICEVKARRGDRHPPELRVDRTKRRHLIAAAMLLSQRASLRSRPVRFDVIAVTLDALGMPVDVRHLAAAFTADDG